MGVPDVQKNRQGIYYLPYPSGILSAFEPGKDSKDGSHGTYLSCVGT